MGCEIGGLAGYGWALNLAGGCDRLSVFGGVETVPSRVSRLSGPGWKSSGSPDLARCRAGDRLLVWKDACDGSSDAKSRSLGVSRCCMAEVAGTEWARFSWPFSGTPADVAESKLVSLPLPFPLLGRSADD